MPPRTSKDMCFPVQLLAQEQWRFKLKIKLQSIPEVYQSQWYRCIIVLGQMHKNWKGTILNDHFGRNILHIFMWNRNIVGANNFESTLIQIIVWFQAASYNNLSQYWPRFLSQYGVNGHNVLTWWNTFCDYSHPELLKFSFEIKFQASRLQTLIERAFRVNLRTEALSNQRRLTHCGQVRPYGEASFNQRIYSSVWPSDAICRYKQTADKAVSTLAHVMACCQTAPSH